MKVLIAGDYYPSNRVSELFKGGNYESVLGEVKPIVEQHDLSIVNLETPILSSSCTPIEKCGPALSADDSALKALNYVGFDLVTLANNHIMDYGLAGYKQTLEALERNKLPSVGAGGNLAEAEEVLYKEINGKRLAIINCCEHEFSIADENQAGTCPLNPIKQYKQIKEAKSQSDFVMVIVHGGNEMLQLPTPRMVETYRFFADVGADVIANHHQHCYTGYEVYNGTPIFYGLGNFCFDTGIRPQIWHEGFLLSLEFTNDDVLFELIPYLQCKDEARVSILKDKIAFNSSIEKFNQIISNPESLRIEVEKNYELLKPMYIGALNPYYSRVSRKLYSLGLLPDIISRKRQYQILNYVECEAHRDRFIYALKSK